MKELVAFVEEAVLLCQQAVGLPVCTSAERRQILQKHGLDALSKLRVQLLTFVVFFDPLLNDRDQHGSLRAVSCLLVAPETDEVGIYRSRAVLGHRDNQPAAALSAEDARFQIMRMFTLLLPRCVRRENVLNFCPCRVVDQWFMAARVTHTAIGHFALVVRRRQDLVQRVELERPTG
ncbi:hypothetical protein QN239_07235 [Mycolicibacterium sp. Y3]